MNSFKQALYPLKSAASAIYRLGQARDKISRLRDHLLPRVGSRDAYVLATGPSLKEQDLSILRGKDVYSMSNAFLHPLISDISPILHGFCAYHPPLVESNFCDWVCSSDQLLPSGTSLVTSSRNERLFGERLLNLNRHVFYCEHIDFKLAAIFGWPRFFGDLIPSPQSAPLMMIPLLVLLGYRRIFLLGCDHTVLRDYGKGVSNFYSIDADPRRNATSGAVWKDLRFHCRAQISLWDQYEYWAGLQSILGFEIINLSTDSWLPFFRFEALSSC